MSPDELAELLAEVEDGDLSAGLRAFYRGYAAARGKPRFGDKTPGHVADMDVLSRVLPEARFVHIIRDGRDVAASLRGLPIAPGDGGIAAIAAAWRDTIWRARRAAAHLPHYTEVRYEALVSEPEGVLRELVRFPGARVRPRDAARPRARSRAAFRNAVRDGRGGRGRSLSRRHEGGRPDAEPAACRQSRPLAAGAERTRRDRCFERFAGGALVDERLHALRAEPRARGQPMSGRSLVQTEHEGRARQAVPRRPRRQRDLRTHGRSGARAARARCDAGGGGARRWGRCSEVPEGSASRHLDEAPSDV